MFRGNISATLAKKVTTPSNEVFQGNEKPLNESEFKAQQAERLRKSGKLSDSQLTAIAFGTTPIEMVQTADGPRNTTPSDALELALSPDKASRKRARSGGVDNQISYKNFSNAIVPYKSMIETASRRLQGVGSQWARRQSCAKVRWSWSKTRPRCPIGCKALSAQRRLCYTRDAKGDPDGSSQPRQQRVSQGIQNRRRSLLRTRRSGRLNPADIIPGDIDVPTGSPHFRVSRPRRR